MAGHEIFTPRHISDVAEFIKAGGVLAYPSESVWGLGCDAMNAAAIERIFTLKARPEHKGLIVLTDSVEKLTPLLADLPKQVQLDLLQKMHTLYEAMDLSNATQAQTWLVPVAKSVRLPRVLTGGFDTLAVRVTHQPNLRHICQAMTDSKNPYGFLVSTSCNPSGQPSATTLSEAMAYFGDEVAYLDAQGLGFTKPSQIIDIFTGKVLR